MRQRDGTKPNDRGAALVEMALVLPILLLLVFGIIEFGRVYNAQLSVTHAAREGVRNYAITGDSGTAIATADAAATGQTILATQVAWTGAGFQCVPDVKGDPSIGEPVTMTISYSDATELSIFIPLWGSLTPTLTGTGTMRCGG